MREIGYQSWSLIPIDSDPMAEEPTITRPPMLTAVVLDRHASLSFQFASSPHNLQITFETTALSGEVRSLEIFRTFTGSSLSPLKEIPHNGWEKSIEGMFTLFSTYVEGVGPFLKLFFVEPDPLVVNRVNFYTND